MGGEFFNQIGYSGELVSRDGMRDDEYSTMGMTAIEKLESHSDEIVSIPGYQASLLTGRKLQLFLVRHLAHFHFMGT